jgi:hypothetical protein
MANPVISTKSDPLRDPTTRRMMRKKKKKRRRFC